MSVNVLYNKSLQKNDYKLVTVASWILKSEEKMNMHKWISDVSTLLRLFHLDDLGANKLLNLALNHWVLHLRLCCTRILLKIRHHLFREKKGFTLLKRHTNLIPQP